MLNSSRLYFDRIRWRECGLVFLLIVGLSACGDDDDSTAVVDAPELVEWTVSPDDVEGAFQITPATALRSAGVYGVIASSGIVDSRGRALEAAAEFAARKGGAPPSGGGPVALYSADPEAAGNPYPDARLVDPDGTIVVPESYALRGIADTAEFDTARALIRAGLGRLGTLRGFSTTAPMRIATSAPVDLDSVTADTLFLFERADGATDLEGLLAIGEALGVARADVALGFSFPTQPIEDDLVAVQALLRERAAGLDEAVDLVDRDPDDDLQVGVFGPQDSAYAEFFARSPEIDTVVVGLVSSPDFRGPDGVWLPELISGDVPAPAVGLDFVLTLPTSGAPPYPVVLLQHGFGGSNQIVFDLGPVFAREGLAVIGISALVHGRRGNPLDLLAASPFVAREIFRQSIADQMAVLRAIETGIDVDGDGGADLDAQRMSYLGISLGGMLGATLVAVEEILPVAVLNVAGGRVAFLGRSEGLIDLVGGALAAEAGLDPDSAGFATYLQRLLETGQHAMDTVDGLNFAQRWFLDPFPGAAPHRILLQEGIGDTLVTNESTEALATAGGLVADTPMSDADGVSGLWRFDPPGGHGIFAREDVRSQAIRFLTSDGTEIIDPEELPDR
jgi:hypothetical protein